MNTKIYQGIINDSVYKEVHSKKLNNASNTSNENPNTNNVSNETCTLSLILLKLHQAETREMLLLEKIEKLEKMLEKKLDTIEKNTQRMKDHINFVEKTYEKVKTPFHFLMDKVNTLPFLSFKKSEIENKEEK
jgi:hypothetical protein